MTQDIINIDGEFTSANIKIALTKFLEQNNQGKAEALKLISQFVLRNIVRALPVIIGQDYLIFSRPTREGSWATELSALLLLVSAKPSKPLIDKASVAAEALSLTAIDKASYASAYADGARARAANIANTATADEISEYARKSAEKDDIRDREATAAYAVRAVENAIKAASSVIVAIEKGDEVEAIDAASISLGCVASCGIFAAYLINEACLDFRVIQTPRRLDEVALWNEIPSNYQEYVNEFFRIADRMIKETQNKDESEIIKAGVAFYRQIISLSGASFNKNSNAKKSTSESTNIFHSETLANVDKLNQQSLTDASTGNAPEQSDAETDQLQQPSVTYEATHESHAEIPATEDKLNRQGLVNALAINLTSETNHHHRTIGLLGEWGSGKSTVLDLLKKRLNELQQQQPFIFGEFNAWSYEHTDNIQAGVAQEMIKALTQRPANETGAITWFRWLTKRAALTFRFACKANPWQLIKVLVLIFIGVAPWLAGWFNGVIGTANSNANTLSFWGKWVWAGGFALYLGRELGKLVMNPHAKELLTYLRLPSYAEHLGKIPVMRENIRILCELRLKKTSEKPSRLLFVVDDLDRCSSKGIVKVLEAIRLVLDLENVIVVIAIDQHIALAALSEYFKDFASHHQLKNSHAIAREYLSKIINLPIVLTKSNRQDVENLMRSFWKDIDTPVENSNIAPSTENAVTATQAADPAAKTLAQPAREPEKNKTKNKEISDAEEIAELQVTVATAPEPSATSYHSRAIRALSKVHQNAFVYWVNYFELANSRQVKRLNNSYDLMRAYLPQWDKTEVEFYVEESNSKKVYPMQLTLVLMEYLNNLKDVKLRNHLWKQLFLDNGDEATSESENDKAMVDSKVNAQFISAYRDLLKNSLYKDLVANVEAFVLPAMNTL